MQNIHLSPHFELREFTESATARQHGIVNEPPPEAVENLRALCVHTMEPLREALGLPIIITSGYRCKALNNKITHHSTRSQHVGGQAADFWVKGPAESADDTDFLSRRNDGNSRNLLRRELLVKAFRTILTDPSVDYDQLILYPGFIRVSFVAPGKNRHNIMSANGQGTYRGLSRADALSLI